MWPVADFFRSLFDLEQRAFRDAGARRECARNGRLRYASHACNIIGGDQASYAACCTKWFFLLFHVAEYLAVLPTQDVLERKLQDAISAARLRFDTKPVTDTL